MASPQTVTIYCTACDVALTGELARFAGEPCTRVRQPYIPAGCYTISQDDRVVINLTDLQNARDHDDALRRQGCCGPDGYSGLNKVCVNGHEVATESSDCWMPSALTFEPGATYGVAAG